MKKLIISALFLSLSNAPLFATTPLSIPLLNRSAIDRQVPQLDRKIKRDYYLTLALKGVVLASNTMQWIRLAGELPILRNYLHPQRVALEDAQINSIMSLPQENSQNTTIRAPAPLETDIVSPPLGQKVKNYFKLAGLGLKEYVVGGTLLKDIWTGVKEYGVYFATGILFEKSLSLIAYPDSIRWFISERAQFGNSAALAKEYAQKLTQKTTERNELYYKKSFCSTIRQLTQQIEQILVFMEHKVKQFDPEGLQQATLVITFIFGYTNDWINQTIMLVNNPATDYSAMESHIDTFVTDIKRECNKFYQLEKMHS